MIADESDHPACRNARLRQDARKVYLAAFPARCSRCGYDKHIEVCHKRSLSSFSLDTPIAVVNHLDNLVGLCPNCHWEFDHGLLQL
jgi:predicted HNH restriction endonuclease